MDKSTPFLALDLELNQPSNRIIQVGIALGSRKQPEEEWLVRQWLLDPEEPISAFITQLTGITSEAISATAVPWSQMAAELGALVDERQPFINPVTWGGGDSAELLADIRERNIDFPHFGRRWIDVKTVHTFLALTQGKNPSGGLRRTMAQYRLQFLGDEHRAHHDARNTLRLFFRLMERQQSLDALVSIAKQVG
ncbi:3'-5' exonuclease [Paraburkholderia sp. A3RO-2L]|uniref:3'-5' exonuclease n=1 Tax=unclassified Paraburkholderia TaxID=2615204 RepID=UPI003DAA1899